MGAMLILFYLAVVLVPVAFAWAQGLEPRGLMDELATGAGLAGLSILLVEFVLSGRFRAVSRPIGQDVTMRFHQLLARSALVLLAAHPILYTRWDLSGPPGDDRRSYVLFELHGLLPGIIAWLLLGAIVAMAIGRSGLGYRYEVWRFLHGAGAVAMAYYGVKHATAIGRYSENPALADLWWGMFGIAVLSLAYVYFLKPAWQLTRPWRVETVEKAAERMWRVTLSPVGHKGLRYQAGQFAWVNFGHSPFSLSENPFSIASAPAEGSAVCFLIKELGDSTDRIGDLRPGTRAYLDAPFGHLTVAGRTEPGVALIAGGVGIAPMVGILRELRATGDPRPTVLVLGNRHEGQIACRDELGALAAEHGTELVHILSEPGGAWTGLTGFLDREKIRALFADRTDWLFVLCGPPPMLEAVEDGLIALGVPSRNILSERFVYD